jgi:hypothetical protein
VPARSSARLEIDHSGPTAGCADALCGAQAVRSRCVIAIDPQRMSYKSVHALARTRRTAAEACRALYLLESAQADAVAAAWALLLSPVLRGTMRGRLRLSSAMLYLALGRQLGPEAANVSPRTRSGTPRCRRASPRLHGSLRCSPSGCNSLSRCVIDAGGRRCALPSCRWQP